MWDNYIAAQMRRANRNLLVLNIGIILTLALAAGATGHYLRNFFAGPKPISGSALAALSGAQSPGQYYVTVEGEKSFDTSVTEVEQTKDKYSSSVRSERTTAHYLLLKVGDRTLLVKAPDAVLNTRFTGALVPIPAETREHVINSIVSDDPKMADRFMPLMLDADDFKMPGYIGLGLGVPLFLLGVWNVLKALWRGNNIESHPIMRTLGAHGDARDIGAQIDSDMQAGAQTFGAATLSSQWLIQQQTFGLNVQRVEDIAWAYKKVTQHRTNFVPTGKTFACVIYTRYGQMREISGSDRDTDALLTQLGGRLPWIVMGFDKQLQTWWAKDRAGLIAAVDQRRRDMTEAS